MNAKNPSEEVRREEVRRNAAPTGGGALSLSVARVTVAYSNGHVALRDASFELLSGTVCALVGMNGAGKSTLFKAIMGFVRPARGEVRISRLPVREAQKRNWVAYVPQAEDVDWAFPVSVWDVVMMGRYGYMNFMRMPRAEDKREVMAALGRVNMVEFKDRQIGELSGGQRKRVFLARALAQRSRLVLLDEPFTGVDVKTEEAIVSLLGELRAEGHIVLVSTHDLGSVPEFCDRVVMINRTVIAAGLTSEVFTAENLSKAFGGVLRQIDFDHTDEPGGAAQRMTMLTDEEGALLLDAQGKVRGRQGPKADGSGGVQS